METSSVYVESCDGGGGGDSVGTSRELPALGEVSEGISVAVIASGESTFSEISSSQANL